MSKVGIVVVSHSRALAQAAVDLAMQMVHAEAPDIRIAAGMDDGGFGTDATAVLEAIQAANSGDGVAVFVDLGSALTSTDLALEMLDDDSFPVEVLSAPFVEGLITGVVQAASGAALPQLAAQANAALGPKQELLGGPRDVGAAENEGGVNHVNSGSGQDNEIQWDASATVEVVNKVGLHARPAAQLAQRAAQFDSNIELVKADHGVDAASMLEIATLGAVLHDVITVRATGPDASEAVAAMVELISSGFSES